MKAGNVSLVINDHYVWVIFSDFIKAKSPPKRAFLMWLGYEDSNLGMPESESGALPLGDTPTNWFLNLPNVFDTFRIWWLRRDSNL